ncbi:DUF6875 domain-containing protein [Geodermatophilus sp. SYSU D00815]
MSSQTESSTTLLLPLHELEGARGLGDRDREALAAVADWITSFIVRPHAELGRPGSVCPFVPRSLDRRSLWLAPERVGDGGPPHVIELMNAYKRRLLEVGATRGDGSADDVIVVVFPDLPAHRAQPLFDEVLRQVAVPSYVEDGIVFGPFYDGHQGTAIYNSDFHPFRSPVPFIFVRHGVLDDWKFFLDQEDWFGHWARRFGGSAAHALAEELRRLPWNARRDQEPPPVGAGTPLGHR